MKSHPWFSQDLPEQLAALNYRLLQALGPPDASLQGVQEIEDLVALAKHPDIAYMEANLFPWEKSN